MVDLLVMDPERRVQRPPQVPPLQRPHTAAPHTTVAIDRPDLPGAVEVRLRLMHGANHGDPGPWAPSPFERRKASR